MPESIAGMKLVLAFMRKPSWGTARNIIRNDMEKEPLPVQDEVDNPEKV